MFKDSYKDIELTTKTNTGTDNQNPIPNISQNKPNIPVPPIIAPVSCDYPEQSYLLNKISCNSPITSLVQYSDDILVSGHQDGNIYFRNITSGALVTKLPEKHKKKVTHLVVFKTNWLISGSLDKLCIWNEQKNCVENLSPARGTSGIGELVAACSNSWFAYTLKYPIWQEEKREFKNRPLLQVWNYKVGSLHLLKSHQLYDGDYSITSVDNTKLAYAEPHLYKSEIAIFDIETGNIIARGSVGTIKRMASFGPSYLALIHTEIDQYKAELYYLYVYNWKRGKVIWRRYKFDINDWHDKSIGATNSMIAFDHGEIVTTHYDRLCIWDRNYEAKTCEALRDFRKSFVPNFIVKLNNFRFASVINYKNGEYNIYIENLRVQQPKPPTFTNKVGDFFSKFSKK